MSLRRRFEKFQAMIERRGIQSGDMIRFYCSEKGGKKKCIEGIFQSLTNCPGVLMKIRLEDGTHESYIFDLLDIDLSTIEKVV